MDTCWCGMSLDYELFLLPKEFSLHLFQHKQALHIKFWGFSRPEIDRHENGHTIKYEWFDDECYRLGSLLRIKGRRWKFNYECHRSGILFQIKGSRWWMLWAEKDT